MVGILSATVPRLRKFFPGVGQELGLTFTNTGEQTAVMKGLQVPLYWRVVQTPPQEVAPGESAAVRFIIATIPLENGPWEKEIALISNSEPAKATFTIAANVRELTAVEQPNISRAHCNYRFENLTVGTYAVAFSDVGLLAIVREPGQRQ